MNSGKRNEHAKKPDPARLRGDSQPRGTSTPEPPKTRARRRGFRIAALLLPLLLLAGIELGLRWLGCGYPVNFFLPARVQHRDVLVENPQFARRYFPPGLARSPQPTVLPAVKPAGVCRVFIFGESAALGDPEPAYGAGRILEVLLGARYPGRRFEVVNVAVTAINSHVIRQIALDCAPRQGDVWILYLGNNEVVGPFGAGTVFGAQAPGLATIRGSIGLKALRLGQWLDSLKYRLARPPETPASWEGMEMFLKQQVREDDSRLATVYAHFERNVDDILAIGRRAGARVLLSTVVSNLKDCPPFASQHRPDLAAAQRAEWDRLYAAGITAEAAANQAGAIAPYQQAARIDDRYAELHFRLGRCFTALGRDAEARGSFERARDLDTLRFRADTRINQILAAAGNAADPDFKLVDAVEVFARHSPHGIPGEELFYEHVHLNFDGNYLLARTLAEQLAGLLPAAITNGLVNPAPLLSAEACARRLALTDWDRWRTMDEMCRRLQQPPFTQQLDQRARLERWQARRSELEAALRPAAFATAAESYRQALAPAPEDWVLHENFARLLERFGDAAGAEQQWRKVMELLPHSATACYSLGNVLDAQGKSGEALGYFQLALRWKPDAIEARNGLGLALASQGKLSEAMRQYKRALREKPDFAQARINLGQALAEQGRVEEAMAQYLAALRADSNSLAAHINLGKLLAGQGQLTGAIQHYREAIRLQPDNPIAHYNLGNALAAAGNPPEAAAQLAEAVRLKPDFAEARYNLGMQLARQGNHAGALPHLAEAVRLKPDFAEARLGFGVALAKGRRFDEAAAQFRETLRLAPDNALARKYLEQAQAALKSGR